MDFLYDDEPAEPTISAEDIASAVVGKPNDVLALDDKFQMIMDKGARQLQHMLKVVTMLNTAIWELADYVPPNIDGNEKRVKIWREILKPQMIKAAVQDIKSVGAIIKSLSAIRDFGIVVNEAGNNVMKLKGSKVALDIAKDLIPKELENITKLITHLDSMELEAINLFAENAEVLLEFAGPESARFAEQEAEVMDQIEKNLERLSAISDTAAMLRLEAERYNNLIFCTKRQMNEAAGSVAEAKARAQTIGALVKESDKNLSQIPDTITVTEVQHHSSGWFIFESHWTESVDVQIPNPDKEAQRNYFEGMIKAQEARLREQNSDVDAKEKVKNALEKECAGYEASYTKSIERFNAHVEQTKEPIAELKAANVQHTQRLQEIREQANSLENEMGMKGSALLNCLSAVRRLAKGQSESCKVFAPLVSVLDGIRKMSESNVRMIESDDPAAVFLGGRNLLAKSSHYIAMYETFQNIYEEQTKHLLESTPERLAVTM